MSLSDHILALTLGSAAAGLLLLSSQGEAAHEPGARMQLQSGPLMLELGGPDWARLGTRSDCLRQSCPLLHIRYQRSAAPQGAPGETRRMQTCETGAFERSWFIAEHADEGLGEQGSVCEAARPETA